MNDYFFEIEYDDEVYEDSFYEDSYKEEIDEEDELSFNNEKEHLQIDEGDEIEDLKTITLSFACDDCDYRWEDSIVKFKGNLEDELEEIDQNCPMCGSTLVTQI